MNITLNVPAGLGSVITPSGTVYLVASGQVTVDSRDVGPLIQNGYTFTTGGAADAAQVPPVEPVNAQTGVTYALVKGDGAKLLTLTNAAAIAVSLPAAGGPSFPNGWWCDAAALGAGTATITPATSTIGGAATLVLTTGQSARIISDGVDYRVLMLGVAT